MTHPPEVLLSDEFAAFSGKLVAMHEKKKEIKEVFKKLYEQHKAEVKELDTEAEKLQTEFNLWADPPKETKQPAK